MLLYSTKQICIVWLIFLYMWIVFLFYELLSIMIDVINLTLYISSAIVLE